MEKLTQKRFDEIVAPIVERQDKWILSQWDDFDDFNEDVKKGDILTIPVNSIVPHNLHEWEFANIGASQTDGYIEMTRAANKYQTELRINDGHNRLKDLINSKIKTTKIIVID